MIVLKSYSGCLSLTTLTETNSSSPRGVSSSKNCGGVGGGDGARKSGVLALVTSGRVFCSLCVSGPGDRGRVE